MHGSTRQDADRRSGTCGPGHGSLYTTNALLSAEKTDSPALLAAEEQSAGRGRHGRRWRSARGAGATFSIRLRMRCEQRRLAGLSVEVVSSAKDGAYDLKVTAK